MSQVIRVRAALGVVRDGAVLLVPHYNTDRGPVQWHIPGGSVDFGEELEHAARREFEEETGLHVSVEGLLDVTEVILPERPWHSITITFQGRVEGGELKSEPNHPYGDKTPRWLSAQELAGQEYHPRRAVERALGIDRKKG